MRLTSLLLLGTFAACGNSVSDVCEMEAKCYEEKECEYTEEACAELAVGKRDKCIADEESYLAAVATSDSGACSDCIDAHEALLDCMADLESCAAFDDADKRDGKCYSEAEKADTACDNVRETCYQ